MMSRHVRSVRRPLRSAAAFGFVVLGLLPGFAAEPMRPRSWSFDSDPPGQIAAGFKSEVGRWEVVKDGDNSVLFQRGENRIDVVNITLIDGTSYKNVDLSVRVKAVTGETEQGGGLIWRAKDKDNFYAVRFNPYVYRYKPGKPNVRLYKVENGKVTQLDQADAPGDKEWHTLRITAVGTDIVGSLDGVKLLEAEDSTFVDVGKIGLMTKADACSYFDDLGVSAL